MTKLAAMTRFENCAPCAADGLALVHVHLLLCVATTPTGLPSLGKSNAMWLCLVMWRDVVTCCVEGVFPRFLGSMPGE